MINAVGNNNNTFTKSTHLLTPLPQNPLFDPTSNYTTSIHKKLIKPNHHQINQLFTSKSSPTKCDKISCVPNQLLFQFGPYPQHQSIQIKNISNQPYKIKISKLKSKLFRILNLEASQENVSVIMVPGLSRKLEIQYMPQRMDQKQRRGSRGQKIDQNQNQEQKIGDTFSGQVYDELKISSQYFTETIPIYVHFKMDEIKYQKVVDLQFIGMNSLTKFVHKVYNNSKTEQISLSLSKQPIPITNELHFYPQQLMIKPMSSQNIEFTLTPSQEGVYHHKILVSKGKIMMDPIEVIYIAAETGCWITFQDGREQVNDVDFGYGYFGKEKNVTLIAVNNTWQYVEMKSKIRVGWRSQDMDSVFQTPEQYGKQCQATTVNINPKCITLAPFSKQKFTLTSWFRLNSMQESKVIKYTKSVVEQFSKTIKPNKKITETMQKYKIEDQEFRQCLVVEFVGLSNNQVDEIMRKEQPLLLREKGKMVKKRNNRSIGRRIREYDKKQVIQLGIMHVKQAQLMITETPMQNNLLVIPLKARYTLPMVRISPVELSFGKVVIGVQQKMDLSITNRNQQLSTHILFGKVLGIQIIPKQIILKPNSTVSINAFVKPSNIGPVNEILKLNIEQSYIVQIRVTYEAVLQINNQINQFNNNNNQKQRTINKYETVNKIQSYLNDHINNNRIKIKQRQTYNSLHSYLHTNSNTQLSDTLQKLQQTCHNQLYSSLSLNKTSNNQKNILNRTNDSNSILNKVSSSPNMFNIKKHSSWISGQKQKAEPKGKEDKLSRGKNNIYGKDFVKSKKQLKTELSLSNHDDSEMNNTLSNENKNKSDSKVILHSQITSYEQHTKPTQSTNPSPIRLPSPMDSLYVTKKIDRYEPYQTTQNTRKLLKSKTSKQFLFSIIKRQPRNRREAQEIMMELKGEQLKMIKINSKTIGFGKVFVGSKVQKQFTISNDTEYTIEVKLKHPNSSSQSQGLESQMLKQTEFNSQLIPPATTGRFPINLWAKQCGKFQKPISYIINNHHEFQFLIEAEIELASLSISKNVLKMMYLDDINDMCLRDTFGLKNDGNADVSFKIQQTYQHFVIQPSEGIVQPGNTVDINVTYKGIKIVINAGESLPIGALSKSVPKLLSSNLSPGLLQQQNQQQNFQEQRITINIKNGVTLSLRATFNPNVTQPRCIVKEQRINFGATMVNKPKNKSFLLRNLSRVMTLFEIQNNQCGEFLEFQLMKGRLPPQSSKEISVIYKSSIIQQLQSSFQVICRGGLTINVPIIAESVAPNIRLLEEEYNFGDLCCGSARVLCVNIINDSESVVDLLLNMLDHKNGVQSNGMEYLFVSLKQQGQQSINSNQQTRKDKKIAPSLRQSRNNSKPAVFSNIPYNLNAQKQAIIQRACIEPQIHKLTIAPKSTYQFNLVFKPLLPGYYEFQLPLYLENFIKNSLLYKRVRCFATEPKFVVEPAILKFKKKIIDEKESEALRSLTEFLTLKNPGDKELKWKIQLPSLPLSINPNNQSQGNIYMKTNKSFPSGLLLLPGSQTDSHFAFHFQTMRGVVKPRSWQCINISFNPYEAGVYSYRVGLWIWNDERGMYQQQAYIRLQGQGQYPMLMFDRRQLIMPVVPLGIESIAMFKVINQGYEAISLKYRLQFYDLEGNSIVQGTNYYTNTGTSSSNSSHMQSLPEITLLFPEGTKMGVNKKQLFILLKFIAYKSISFTCKLQLYDDTKDHRVYEIPVSGTTDCSILTIWPFLNDEENKYDIIPGVWNPNLHQQQRWFSPQGKQKPMLFGSGKQSKHSTIFSLLSQSIIIQSIDNRSPIDRYHHPYDKLKIQHFSIDCEIVRRWINGVLKDEKVGKFPHDLTKDIDPMLKMLTRLTGRKQFEQLSSLYNSIQSINNSQTSSIQQPQQTKSPTNNIQNPSSSSNVVNNAAISPIQQFLMIPEGFSSKYEFYEYLIRLLKSMGCLLNHIRPQFLLPKEQFIDLIQPVPGWKYMSQTYLKSYQLIHTEAWLILFYQIVNSFWYNTIKLKSTLSLDKNHQKDSSSSFPTSNSYSSTELTILKWIKGVYQKYNQFDDINHKFLSYGQDFKDCTALAYVVYEHIANPQKKTKALQGLIGNPLNSNQRKINLKILYELIQKAGLVPIIYQEQFFSIKQKQMFMFLYQLYETLPQQMPKVEPIYFECNLGEKCVKLIEIKNTSNKAVHYWIKLEGSRDFTHEQKEFIRVEAKSVYKFKVSFMSRVSKQEVGYLTFLNKLQSSDLNSTRSGLTLVFQLHSRIIGRKSIKKLQSIICQMYQSQMVRIPIQNSYDQYEYGQFEIELFEQILSNGNDVKGKKNNEMTRMFQLRRTVQSGLQENKQVSVINKEHKTVASLQSVNFFLNINSIKIKRGSTSFIELYFNPIIYHKIRCYIIFHDPLVGEFQYQIIGICQIPKPVMEIKHPTIIYTAIKEIIDISVPQFNNPMIKANLLLEQKLLIRMGQLKHRPSRNSEQYIDNELFKVQLNMDNKILSYISFPVQFSIKSSILKQQGTNNEQLLGSNNKLRIECLFDKVFKDLCLDFLLVNGQRTDVRRIKVHLNLANKQLMNEIIMKTTARVPIIQPIPIENPTAKDWRVKVTLTQDQQGQDFRYMSLKEGERLLFRDLIIKQSIGGVIPSSHTTRNLNLQRKSITNINSMRLNSSQGISLVFNPSWVCNVRSKLHIHNVTTNQHLMYYIKAVCEQPISQGHFMFMIRAGVQQQRVITVKNPYQESGVYKIETDLSQISISQRVNLSELFSQCQIPIRIYSEIVGKSIGYIRLIDKQRGRFFWYSIIVDFYEQQIQQTQIDISCQLGQRVQQTLLVKNSINKSVVFTIQCPQNCFLLCQKQLQVEKETTRQFIIVFQPKQLIRKTVTIKVFNKLVGNFLYKLSLFTIAVPTYKPNHTVTAEVNKLSFISIPLYNPLNRNINITSQLTTSSKFFSIQCPNQLGPMSSNEMIVEFRPLVEGNYHCGVKVYGQELQTKLYEVEGIGIKPFSIEKIQMKAQVDSTFLQIVKFKNPDVSKTIQTVQISLQSFELHHNYFTIVTQNGHSHQWTTKITDIIAIPIQFSPQQKGYFQTMLYIRLGNYQWKYMIKGTTNSKIIEEEIKDKILSQCRKQIVKIIKIPIPLYLQRKPNFAIEMMDGIEIQCSNHKILQMLKSWMRIKIQSDLYDNSSNTFDIHQQEEQQQLTLTIKFTPLQPFQEIIDLIVYSTKDQALMRLSHRIKIVSNPPDPDQSIEIDINTFKKYKFDLDLHNIGVTKRGIPTSCSMIKGDFIECKFKDTYQQVKELTNSLLNTSQRSLQIQKLHLNSVIEVIFSPNNLMFSSSKGKNRYSDVLMVFTQKDYWSCEIIFKFNNIWQGNRKL